MSLDDEYQAHKRRQESLYVLAYEEFEKNLSAKHRRILGAAAIPDIEDTRSHGSRRVSLGVLTDAAERVSASYTPDISEQVDGTGEDPSPELLAEMLGLSVDLVEGAILEEIKVRFQTALSRRNSELCLRESSTFTPLAIVKIIKPPSASSTFAI